ncbi:oxidative stress defense protein [Serratia proteamaculans]|uniref:oxidative stress defense protein n=1 Tax=Serratia proteamaculans TaxID=28151 RepID=UPI0009F7EE21|nr:oxidative stress defense protein [Serratia proteamaculans]CAI1036900.1 26 kDa periplasmic immunogenic protein precursor [Serratia proteamaculans]CAI1508489.1 26 kDa periplasmic immunogenic protein precursor [Serratia proteamaculans]CAI1837059.1 26 kDa periplasmic immunogenic protein precursor [Serratia proteamaculans]CAI1911916.1 26 kDa periplasmic immunogenic protein precursor [Serratia proteamaculans]CAI1991937.1 26 kDa periplasmic immunogenic protein precursor [Serratia proteamaculans]
MKLKALAMAAMVGLGTLPLALQAAEVPEGPHVVTSGTSSVDAIPDIATLAIEVSVSSKDAAQAKKQVDERVAQYFDFLQKNNIEKKDISAANLRTQPEYDYLKTGESVLKGYRAVRQVQVTLRQLDKLNELLDGALKSGLNEIRAVELGVAKPDVYREQARQKAIENATQQAASLAKGFNAKLGPVYSIRYHVANYQPMPVARMYKSAGAAAESDAAQTYEQQSIHFDDQVDVVFELQRNAAQ